MSTQLRPESEADVAAIAAVHRAAFGRDAEARLVAALRRTDAVVVSLIAESARRVVGHVLLSRLDAPLKALALAPVAVLPAYQRQGIGSALIGDALEHARATGWEAVSVLGAPAFYGRFGFDRDGARGYACRYAGAHFMVRRLVSRDLPDRGPIGYPAAFDFVDEGRC
jgi:putative acetyltransferase